MDELDGGRGGRQQAITGNQQITAASDEAFAFPRPITSGRSRFPGGYSVRLQPVEPSGEKLGNRRGRLKALQENLYHSGERNG